MRVICYWDAAAVAPSYLSLCWSPLQSDSCCAVRCSSQVSPGDVLSRLIQYGGFIGDLAAGLPYLLARWLGYFPPDVAGHNPDYGSKLIVAAGLLNILAMVDAYEINSRQKD